MADQDLELRRRGGRVVSLALPAFLPSAISFIPEIRGLGSGPPGPSRRFATEECRSWIIFHYTKWSAREMGTFRRIHVKKKSPFGLFRSRERNFKGALSRYLDGVFAAIEFQN